MEEKLKEHLTKREQRLKNSVSNSGTLLLKQLKIIQHDLELSNKALERYRLKAIGGKTQILNRVAKTGSDAISMNNKVSSRKQTRN